MGQILSDLSIEEESKDETEMHVQLKSQCLLICSIFRLLNKLREEDEQSTSEEVAQLEK